jgi:hypothetical protein
MWRKTEECHALTEMAGPGSFVQILPLTRFARY